MKALRMKGADTSASVRNGLSLYRLGAPGRCEEAPMADEPVNWDELTPREKLEAPAADT